MKMLILEMTPFVKRCHHPSHSESLGEDSEEYVFYMVFHFTKGKEFRC